MPASAESALQGLLKEGTTAAEVLEKLEESGYKVSPPEGDESYVEGEPAGEEISEVDAMPEGMVEEEAEGPPPGLAAMMGPKPEDRRKKAVDEAFAESGY